MSFARSLKSRIFRTTGWSSWINSNCFFPVESRSPLFVFFSFFPAPTPRMSNRSLPICTAEAALIDASPPSSSIAAAASENSCNLPAGMYEAISFSRSSISAEKREVSS